MNGKDASSNKTKQQTPEPDWSPKDDLKSIVPYRRGRSTCHTQTNRHPGSLVAALDRCPPVTTQLCHLGFADPLVAWSVIVWYKPSAPRTVAACQPHCLADRFS